MNWWKLRKPHWPGAPADGATDCCVAAKCRDVPEATKLHRGKMARYSINLVGGGEEPDGYLNSECPGGLEVDDHLKLGRLYYRHFSRPFAFENPRWRRRRIA